MDDATRRAFIQALHSNTSMSQDTRNDGQPGAGPAQSAGEHESRSFPWNQYTSNMHHHIPPEAVATQILRRPDHCMFHPGQHSSNTRMFYPASSLSNVQFRMPTSALIQPTYQRSAVTLPSGAFPCAVTSTSQLEMSTLQRVYQPVQQQPGSSPDPRYSLNNNTNQRTYQPSRLRQGPSHGQSGRGRFHPYETPQYRPSHGPSHDNPQSTSQASSPIDLNSSPIDLTSSPNRSDTPAQHLGSTVSRVQITLDPRFLPFLQECDQSRASRNITQIQQQLPLQTPSPGGIAHNLRSVQAHQVRHPSLNSPRSGPPSLPPLGHGSSGSWGRIWPPVRREPPPTQSPQPPKPPRAPQSPQQPLAPPRVWCPKLHTITYLDLVLRAQPDEEADNPSYQTLLGKTQERSLEKLRPHEFTDYLTMDHNACFKPKVARMYDLLFMQALFFFKDRILLVSPKALQEPCWGLPQSVWSGYDLGKASAHAPIDLHVFKALNVVSDLQLEEVIHCEECKRHDSAVDLVKTDGGLTHGWSVAVSYKFRDDAHASRFRNLSPDMAHAFVSEDKIRSLNMDPVWKAKVLDIFKLRRSAKNARSEIGRVMQLSGTSGSDPITIV